MNEKKIIKNIYRLLDGELNPREKDVFEIYLACLLYTSDAADE